MGTREKVWDLNIPKAKRIPIKLKEKRLRSIPHGLRGVSKRKYPSQSRSVAKKTKIALNRCFGVDETNFRK